MFNQAALTNKAWQFSQRRHVPRGRHASGEPIHDLKLEALEEIIDEAQGQQVLCCIYLSQRCRTDHGRFKRFAR